MTVKFRNLNSLMLLLILVLYACNEENPIDSRKPEDQWAQGGEEIADITVNQIVTAQNDAGVLYACTNQGLFKSTNVGERWELISSDVPSLDIKTLAVDPVAANVLYLGTWGKGAFKSTDGGASWSAINDGLGMLINDIVILPKNPQMIFAGCWPYVYQTRDGGKRWVGNVDNFPATPVRALTFLPENSDIVLAATGDRGVVKSENLGVSWYETNHGLPTDGGGSYTTITALAINPNAASVIYLATGPPLSQGVYKSTDAGGSWIQKINGLYEKDVRSLVIDPSNPNRLFCGTVHGVFETVDGAETWRNISGPLAEFEIKSLLILEIIPRTLLAGSVGHGIYRLKL